MFSIYLDDKILYSTDLYDEYDTNLISPSCTVEIGRAGALSFTLPPSHYLYGEVKKLVSVVRAYYMRAEIFNGRVLQTLLDTERNKTVQCEGNLTYFLDSAFPPLEDKMTVKDFFLLCLASHNAQVEPAKQFTPGIINAKKINEEEIFSLTGFTDTKTVLDDTLINSYGGYLRTRALGDRTYIDYIRDYGKVSNQILEFGENILEFSQEEDANDIFTVLIPIGDIQQVDQENLKAQIITTIAPANNGSTMIDLPIGQERYGRIVKTETFSGITDPQELKNRALQYIEDNHTEPPLKLTLRAIDLKAFNWTMDMFEVGVQYRVVSKPHNIDRLLTCSKIEYRIGDLANTKLTLEVLKQQVGGNSFRPLKGESLSSAVGGSSGGRGGGSGGKAWKHITEGDDWVKIAAKQIDIVAENLDIEVENLRIEAKDAKEGLETSITQTASEIRLEAKNTKEELESSISVTAEQIRAEVENTKDGLETSINQTATEIRLEAANTKQGLESSISQTAESIRSDVRNIQEGLESSINQTASSIRLEVKNVKENLQSEIDVKADSITLSTVKGQLEGSIQTLAGEVRLKASSADMQSALNLKADSATMNTIKGDLEGSIQTLAGEVALKASAADMNSKLNLKADSATLSTVKGQLEGSIQTLAGEVNLKASAASMNSALNLKADSATLETVRGNLQSSITTNARNIDLKVSKNGVITSINVSSEGVKINASKLNVSGIIEAGGIAVKGDVTGLTGSFDNLTSGATTATFLKATTIQGTNSVLGAIITATNYVTAPTLHCNTLKIGTDTVSKTSALVVTNVDFTKNYHDVRNSTNTGTVKVLASNTYISVTSKYIYFYS